MFGFAYRCKFLMVEDGGNLVPIFRNLLQVFFIKYNLCVHFIIILASSVVV